MVATNAYYTPKNIFIKKMLLYIILFSVVLKSITCNFPPYIERCPMPDPNANDCLLNSARNAMPYVVHGDPALGLVNYDIVYLNGDSLILEYNYPTNNTEIQLTGSIVASNDTILYEARINFNWPTWNFLMGGSLLTSSFNFTLNIYDESRTIQAKGQISLTQDNWKLNYNADYVKEKIDNEIYMQIRWAYAYVSDDTFDVNYIGITTLDDQPLTATEMIRVKKALRNFENSLHGKQSEIGEKMFTDALNTILKLVPENEVFIPVTNQCPDYE